MPFLIQDFSGKAKKIKKKNLIFLKFIKEISIFKNGKMYNTINKTLDHLKFYHWSAVWGHLNSFLMSRLRITTFREKHSWATLPALALLLSHVILADSSHTVTSASHSWPTICQCIVGVLIPACFPSVLLFEVFSWRTCWRNLAVTRAGCQRLEALQVVAKLDSRNDLCPLLLCGQRVTAQRVIYMGHIPYTICQQSDALQVMV